MSSQPANTSEPKEEKKNYLYNDIKEIKRSILYLAGCIDKLQKNNAQYQIPQQIYELIDLKIASLSKELDKKFKLLAGGQAYEYGLYEHEFEHFRKEYLKKLEQQLLEEQKYMYELKIRAIQQLIDSMRAIREFYTNEDIKSFLGKDFYKEYFVMKLQYQVEEIKNFIEILKNENAWIPPKK